MPPYISALLVLLVATIAAVYALGEPCSTVNNRLDASSHRFLSDCGPTEFCGVPDPAPNPPAGATHPANATTSGAIANYADEDEYNEQDGEDGIDGARLKRQIPRGLNLAVAQQPILQSNATQASQVAQNASSGTTCQPKGCRRDEFPYGYGQNDILPPRCNIGEFCPDEEDYCEPLVPVGGACQLNRDDQCLPPPNAPLLANENNFNGSICLAYTCMYANVSVGETCIIDNTVYSGFLPDGSQFTDIVSRDNCATNLFCSSDSLLCELRLLVGSPCTSDSQCQSGNCDTSNLCVVPPETPQPVARYVLVLVPLGILSVMSLMVIGLWKCHQSARKRRSAMLHEYWTEQMAYRKSIMSMHSAATKRRRAMTSVSSATMSSHGSMKPLLLSDRDEVARSSGIPWLDGQRRRRT